MVEVGMGQEDGVEVGRLEGERDPVADRFVRAALEHPAVDEDPGPLGDEQELRAGDGRRATEEVDLHGAHGDRRRHVRGDPAAYPRWPWASRTVERSFGELLGRVRRPRRRAVARRAGRPGGGLDACARASLPSAGGARSTGLAGLGREVADSAAARRARAREHARGARRGSTSSSRRRARDRPRAARPTRMPRVARARAALYRRYGAGGRVDPVRRRDDRSADRAGPPGHRGGRRVPAGRCSRRWRRSGAWSTATAVTPARTDACCGRAPRAGRSTGRRSRRTPSPSGSGTGRSRGCSARSSPRGGRSSGRGASSRGTTGTSSGRPRGGSTGWCRPTGSWRSTTTTWLPWARIRATLGHRYDILPRPGRPPVPVAFTLGMGRGPPTSRGRPWTPRPPWVFATYADGGVGNLLELLHESGHALHAAALRTRPAFLEFPMSSAGVPRGDRRHPGLGRRRAGVAASLAGRGRGAARGAPQIGTAR